MRIRDPIAEADEPFNMIPLTDMVFNLLIFFMAATTFAQVEREMGLALPKTAAFASLSAAPQQLVINVGENGQPVVAAKAYSIDGIAELVKAAVGKNPDASIIIRSDRRGAREPLLEVFEACKRAGGQKVNISFVSGG